jgi:hypothetical protein
MNKYDKRQLLCTFSNDRNFKETSKSILEFYNVYNNRIFVFSNVKIPAEIYLTYNVINMDRNGGKFPNTILIHRKKQFNTIYTLNGMNRLIEDENGKMDKSFMVNWKLYENSLILTGDISVRIVPLKILTIID